MSRKSKPAHNSLISRNAQLYLSLLFWICRGHFEGYSEKCKQARGENDERSQKNTQGHVTMYVDLIGTYCVALHCLHMCLM